MKEVDNNKVVVFLEAILFTLESEGQLDQVVAKNVKTLLAPYKLQDDNLTFTSMDNVKDIESFELVISRIELLS